jgi:SMC interacting uncharacterized protein involved in chromosome segregation
MKKISQVEGKQKLKQKEVSAEIEFEKLKNDVFKTASELKSRLQEIDEKYKNLKPDVKKLKDLIFTLSRIKTKQKEDLEKFRKEVYSSLTSKIRSYKSRLDDLNKKINELNTKYSQFLASFHDKVIKPYKEILSEEQKFSEEVKSIENRINEISKKVEESKKSLGEYSKKSDVIKTLLSKYAVRKTFGEESLLVTELLNETPDNLKAAIEVGKKIGYTTDQLRPLIGAYGLLNYTFGKGVSQEAANAIGVKKEAIEDYIVEVAMNAADFETNSKIVERMTRE